MSITRKCVASTNVDRIGWRLWGETTNLIPYSIRFSHPRVKSPRREKQANTHKRTNLPDFRRFSAAFPLQTLKIGGGDWWHSTTLESTR